MKDYSNIVSKITSTPWMIEESSLRMILEILDAHMKGEMSQEDIRQAIEQRRREHGETRHSRNAGSVGILALSGPIFPKANLMTELSGATSVEQFQSEFRAMLNDDNVESIVLDIDSPGGLSSMIPEMAKEVYEGNKVKPIVAVANTMAASAAYYIGSQAGRMFASPSALVGSIGTYTVHTDTTERDQAQGIKNTVIKAGKFKAISEEPLDRDAKDHLQNYVDEVNEGFLQDVARGRRTTREDVFKNYGEGGLVSLQQAQSVGMIDGVKTLDEVLTDMTTPSGGLKQWVKGIMHTDEAMDIAQRLSELSQAGLDQSYDADKEHSEPGTGQGGEPTPREAPETGDRAIEGGWRRDPPPPAYEPEPEQREGGVVVDRAQLEALATRLNLTFTAETTDEELSGLVNQRVDEIVVPLNTVVEEAERARQFATDYPEEASRLARMEQRGREGDAAEFAQSYERFSDRPKHGFSTLVREVIQQAHLKVSDRQFTHEDLTELCSTVASDKAIVQWGEEGSAVDDGRREVTQPGTNPRKQLHELVKSRMEEDSMPYAQALSVVSAENPELAQAYLNS